MSNRIGRTGAVAALVAALALASVALWQPTAQVGSESDSSELAISGVTAITFEENGVAIIFTYGVSGG